MSRPRRLMPSKTSSTPHSLVDSRTERGFARALLKWFKQNGRHDLPWQHPRTPYYVWLSEVMLQQTQVATVIPYFNRFIKCFPTVSELAAAKTDAVLALWAGLGYYARARNLHKAAHCIVEKGMPSTVEEWAALPGVGPSTAAAIVAQSYNQRAPILDGNVKRVIARLTAFREPINSPSAQKTLWAIADTLTPSQDAANYTQAIMDLGATVCKRNNPLCEMCPVSTFCQAFATQQTDRFPIKTKAPPKPTRTACFALIRSASYLWLEKRPNSGIWGGLWSLPLYPKAMEKEVVIYRGRHTFTHFHLNYEIIEQIVENIDEVPMESGEWVEWEKLPEFGLPAPIKKVLYSELITPLD